MREKTKHWKLPVAVCLAALLALGSIFAVRTETEAASAGKKKAKAVTTAVQKKKDSSKEKNIGSYFTKSFVFRTAKHSICADHAFRRREASSG